ncbi:AvaI/BsoBI family type II restriction endonuclease [Culturomica sp.]|uniref:AvaI/BsoBI family type II restriction endonuclease n=1 Tax=Culturomica sp. TaxID=1926652 RepID=UPI000E8A0E3D|nr:AvaI/BsoBI family type II restriction endonuclease [Culturomica sp.]HBO25263.1 restriction endonuclease [Culturomica sp.]
MHYKKYIKQYEDLVTSREQTRAGFISFALEKNRRSTPYIESAKSFKQYAQLAETPKDLLNIPQIRLPLLTAAGLSDKALNYFTEKDKDEAINELIKNFLEPAGETFVDEAVYRFLLIKGDSLGGSMRNLVGAIAQQRLIRTLLSNMSIMNINYNWIDTRYPTKWQPKPMDDYEIENNLKAISWSIDEKKRTLAFNLTIPRVSKNIDICLFGCGIDKYNNGKTEPTTIIMLGELKGGIDPAGADEHWKTASSALSRIRNSCNEIIPHLKTSFVGAAIEKSMAREIWDQLESGVLDHAANMTVEEQLINYCDWILSI